MNARSAVIEVPVDQVDSAVSAWVTNTMPQYRDQPGYRGFTLLIDRENGGRWESRSGRTPARSRRATISAPGPAAT